jgi:hypothetical protein
MCDICLNLHCRGMMTAGWQEWKVKKDKFGINAGTLGTPGFDSLKFDGRKDSLCQNVIMSREIRYNKTSLNSCEHYISYQVKHP